MKICSILLRTDHPRDQGVERYRGLREADQIDDLVFSVETFPLHARYRIESHAATEMTFMSQRMKVQEMVMQMHEKNLVLINIIRDIAENETSCHLSAGATDEELVRSMTDRTVRRKEILGEIFNFLRKEEMARRVNA